MPELRSTEYQSLYKAAWYLIQAIDPSTRKEKDVLAALDTVLKNAKKENFGEKATLIKELLNNLTVESQPHSIITGHDTGHKEWYSPDPRKTPMWNSYRNYLIEEKRFSLAATNDIDKTTDEIMRNIENPKRSEAWDSRGLVVGSVQSGKTSNFVGLINKAVDHGYKIIIVLSGLTNNLRQQTQIRLDDGFLGYETTNDSIKKGFKTYNKLGLIRSKNNMGDPPGTFTSSDLNGDFKTSVAQQTNIHVDHPILFVVKKNKSVLENLIKYLCGFEPGIVIKDDFKIRRKGQQGPPPFISSKPILIIDDEVDQGSVDTKNQEYDQVTEAFNQDHDPTKINALIRKILNLFTRRVYIGYTATPFANIFIHHERATNELGPDLFPKNFIIDLPIPDNHVGLEKIFPVEVLDDGIVENSEIQENNFFELINDHCDDPFDPNCKDGWMPPLHDKSLNPKEHDLPESLKEAILSFILICSCRNYRGFHDQSKSMLVHVTRYNDVQNIIFEQIQDYLLDLRKLVETNEENTKIVSLLKKLWNKNFLSKKQDYPNEIYPEFEELLKHPKGIGWVINQVFSNIKKLTSKSDDKLDYEEFFHKQGFALHTLVIGGEKLARGLTLDGLCMSYFLRSAKMPMYDTLMQMGRWFGYRPGYEDLCRLYSTRTIFTNFFKISAAMDNLRQEFRIMSRRNPPATPLEFGLKVSTHPDLAITSATKRRNAKSIKTCFQMEGTQTVTFHKDKNIIESNFSETSKFLNKIGKPLNYSEKEIRDEKQNKSWSNSFIWKNIDSSFVIDFLNKYKRYAEDPNTHDTKLYATHISTVNKFNEMKEFTVCLFGNGSTDEKFKLSEYEGNLMLRTPADTYSESKISLKTITQPIDEAIDLTADEYSEYERERENFEKIRTKKQQETQSSLQTLRQLIRHKRDPRRGLICIYPILGITDLKSYREYKGHKGSVGHGDFKKIKTENKSETPLIGVMLSFPRTLQPFENVSTEWMVNSVYQEQEQI